MNNSISMGNQLAATPTVDLANVSADLELIAPLGAEGRNYFATFHCLSYTPLLSAGSAASKAASAPTQPQASASALLPSDNAPGYATDFLSVDGPGRRSEYRPTSLYYPPTASASSPLTTSMPPRNVAFTRGGHGRGGARGVGGNGGDGRGSGLYIVSAAASLSGAWGSNGSDGTAACTTGVASRERAAWHQARWRQRLPVAARPWRVAPAHFVSEACPDKNPAGDVMDRWCRDSTAVSPAFPHSGASRFDPSAGGGRSSSSFAPSLPLSPAPSFAIRGGPSDGNANASNADVTVAGVVGEWRGNYGNYVQLLLHGGRGAAHSGVVSAALCDGQIVGVAADAAGTTITTAGVNYGALPAAMMVTVPSSSGAMNAVVNNNSGGGGGGGSGSGSPFTQVPQAYVMHDVVIKVFVRTQDDPGQAYFLKRVRQMMDNAGEQLSVIDSTLARITPRNCLWYTLVYEGEGFCVLQRPYVAFTLRERLTARPGWTAHEKLFIAFQLLQAVAHLHETYGLTHGDIKPNNVLVQSTGVVVLCDMAPFKPWRLPLDSPLLFDYYYDTDESRACYVAPEKFSDQPLPSPPLESKTPGSATYNVGNLNFDGHTPAMDVFSTACVLLFLYREEDPFTLSEVLNLHHLSSVEAREKAVLPVLQESGVPPALQPLLRSMLCSASADRPSARELLTRGVQQHVFPAYFTFLYEDVWPRLLTQSPDARLRLLQNQLDTILQHCTELGCNLTAGSAGKAGQGGDRACFPAVRGNDSANTRASSHKSAAAAVSVLLPLLLQTLHSTRPSDEATFRGLLCLRQCIAHCSFEALTDLVLPHLVYLFNNDTHLYGPATRLIALRLLCSVAETIARQLTTPQTRLCPTDGAAGASTWEGNFQDHSFSPDEEQWTLLEHLVLPCLYDVLRQGEQESVAVLVELAERLPRLLLFARFLTERRQVLYDAEDAPTAAAAAQSSGSHPSTPPPNALKPSDDAKPPVKTTEDDATVQLTSSQLASNATTTREEKAMDLSDAMGAPGSSTPPPQQSSATAKAETNQSGETKEAESSGQVSRLIDAKTSADSSRRPSGQTTPVADASAQVDAPAELPGGSLAGASQYLAQLRCLRSNGWSMLQVLYNHPCVAVAAAMMQQTSSTVAAFLGDERVAEDLIPLLTTALTGPLRVVRVLFPQAILLHALLQKPQAKTLRLFVEEGLRKSDDVCLKATLDSVAVVVRSKKLPLTESMALVHQTLPFLIDGRLWLREAACGVVEAAAQTYSPSVIALHLEYAVRPLLTHPVPLSQLRRFAASIIHSELAAASLAVGQTPALFRIGGVSREAGSARGGRGDHVQSAGCSFFDGASYDCFAAHQAGVCVANASGRGSADAHSASWRMDYRDALPSVVSVAASTTLATAPALLHTLPQSVAATAVCSTNMLADSRDGDSAPTLMYKMTAREAARVSKECNGAEASASTTLGASGVPRKALTATSAATTAAGRPSAFASLALHSRPIAVAPPHVVELSPLPTTLAAHSSICRSDIPVATAPGGQDAPHNRSPALSAPSQPSSSVRAAAAGGPITSAATTMVTSATVSPLSLQSTMCVATTARCAALRPIAAPLSRASAHMGAIYTVAAAPASASGAAVVVTAGARGEAMTWRVGSALTHTVSTPELTLVERVARLVSASTSTLAAAATVTSASASAASFSSSSASYVASQWMDVALPRADGGSSATTVPATANTVALASTDGVVGLLDVERNAWLWSTAVGCGDEGTPTGLALHDRRSLLVTTAAGGLHVIDTRCRGVPVTSDTSSSSSSASPYASTKAAWTARLNPLDGAPSCLLPLYTGDRACAAVVGTYGGAVCLFDLRYQICAQRTVVVAVTAPHAVSITCGAVDPLSSLCRACRPSSWEPAVPGPSVLLGTAAGTVYRFLLESSGLGAYWPAFQCRSDRDAAAGDGGNSVRCLLTQPSKGSVFTGTADGYVRHWSTDRPETSHTMTCMPYTSPPYTVTCSPLAGVAADVSGGGEHAKSAAYGVKRLAALTVCEGSGGRGGERHAQHALPHHAPDAILTLCAVQNTAEVSSRAASWSGIGEGTSYLLSGARDGSITLWNNTASMM